MVVIDTVRVAHHRLLEQCRARVRQEAEERRHLIAPRRIHSVKRTRAGTTATDGHARMRRIQDALSHAFRDREGRTLIRSQPQIDMHQAYIAACLPKIFQETWQRDSDAIKRRYGVQKLEQEVLVLAPRRSGKTVSVGMFCAALLVSVPSLEISIFATAQRTAAKLLKEVRTYVEQAIEYFNLTNEWKILKRSAETIIYQGADGSERIVSCYPSSSSVSIPSPSLSSIYHNKTKKTHSFAPTPHDICTCIK